jgi:hypothetical protein
MVIEEPFTSTKVLWRSYLGGLTACVTGGCFIAPCENREKTRYQERSTVGCKILGLQGPYVQRSYLAICENATARPLAQGATYRY